MFWRFDLFASRCFVFVFCALLGIELGKACLFLYVLCVGYTAEPPCTKEACPSNAIAQVEGDAVIYSDESCRCVETVVKKR